MLRKVAFHSMVNFNGDLYIIGGESPNSYMHKAIYKLVCYFGNHMWTIIKQELKEPRTNFVAIPIANYLVDCKPKQ